MAEELFTDEMMEELVNIVIDDSNKWDLMTGGELNKRLKAHIKSRDNLDLLRLFSCLKNAEVIVLRKKQGDSWASPIFKMEEKLVVPVYSTPAKIDSEDKKQFSTCKMLLDEVIDIFADSEAEGIILNPNTDNFFVGMETLIEVFDRFDAIEWEFDEPIRNGIEGKELTALQIERLGSRDVAVDLINGDHYEGFVSVVTADTNIKPLVHHIEIDLPNGDVVEFNDTEIKFIKDITDYDEDDGEEE